MDSQPTELLLKQILFLEYQDIINLCSVNDHLRQLCKDNKEYIYKNLLKRDFGFYNDDNGSKVIYQLLTELYNNDFSVFSIYDAIKSHDYKKISYLINLGFIGSVKNIEITPLEYVLINYNINDPDQQKILDLVVESTIKTDEHDYISLTAYITSKHLSDEHKKKLLTRFKAIVNTRNFISSIKDYYFKDDLKNVINYIKQILDPELQTILRPQPKNIIEAIQINDLDTLKVILVEGRFVQNDLDTALSIAISTNNIDLIDLLLINGANINNNNQKPLLEAVYGSSVAVIDHLLKRGSDINSVINNVLKIIVKRSRYDVAELILTSEVSLNNVKPNLIQELFKMFRRKVREDLIQLLESKGFTNENPIIWM